MTDAAFSRQANRLRFSDAAQERRFRAQHDERTLRQWRLATSIGALAVTLIGLFYGSGGPYRPSDEVETFGRFGFVLPWFLVQFGATFWPAARPRLQLIGAVCCSNAVFLYFLTECFALSTGSRLSVNLTVSLFSMASQFLIAVAVTVPLRTTAMAPTLLVTNALFYLAITSAFPEARTRPQFHRVVVELTCTHAVISLILVAVTWARERWQRLSFAQQEQLTAMNAELARLNAEKNEFMAIAAHDLRAPLAAVGGTAEQLAPRASDPALAKGFALIADQSRRMLSLVNDYLGAHAAESGQLPVRLAPLELGRVAHDAAQRHAATAAAKSQRLELGGTAAGVQVAADAALLAQVVDNFVTNALKFSPAGAIVRLEVQTAAGHPRARLAVIDRGPGIAPDEQANLFRKFGRASTRPTGGESSHGLGLAVAKRLAEAMGGSVGCDSESGSGATFWIELPRSA